MVALRATALTCSLLDKYCFCVFFFYFLLFVCLHISSFFFYLNGEIKMYITDSDIIEK